MTSVRLISTLRLSSIRSASACRSSASGSLPFWRLPPGEPTSSRLAVEYDDTVVPMPQKPSMYEATAVACSRSPDTPVELSVSKNIRSPASEASDTRMSVSHSLRHRVNWSSGGMLATMPR